jgi:hypothetical protein
MDIKRISFSGGWAFDTGARIFHAGTAPPVFGRGNSYILVEFMEDGSMPLVGEFRTLDLCEAAIRSAIEQRTTFPGDHTPHLPLELEKSLGMEGMHWFYCRRRTFVVAQSDKGQPWLIGESLPLATTIYYPFSFRSLADCKIQILHMCREGQYEKALTTRKK